MIPIWETETIGNLGSVLLQLEENGKYSLVNQDVSGFGIEEKVMDESIKTEDTQLLCRIISVKQPKDVEGFKWYSYQDALQRLKSNSLSNRHSSILIAAMARYKNSPKSRRK